VQTKPLSAIRFGLQNRVLLGLIGYGIRYEDFPTVVFDADGHEIGIVFETTTPFDTPREMEDLIAWTRKAIEEEAMHSLLVAAIFIVTFLAIHPFQDGNGRLSRILTTLLLLRVGYAYVPYASLERVIEENKDLYYKALRRTQTTLKSDTPDWEPWIGFFLRLQDGSGNLVGKRDHTYPRKAQSEFAFEHRVHREQQRRHRLRL
jgi:Fic family protein